MSPTELHNNGSSAVTVNGTTYCRRCLGQIMPPGRVGCVCGAYGTPALSLGVVIAACAFAILMVIVFAIAPSVTS